MKATINLRVSSAFLALITLLLIALVFSLTSCERSSIDGLDIKVQEAVETIEIASQNFDDFEDLGNDAFSMNSSKSFSNFERIISDCAEISSQLISDTLAITIDFGTEGCLCNDEKTRQGILLMKFTGNFWDNEKVIVFETNNYFVDGNQIVGKKIITKYNNNENGNPGSSYNVTGKIILANNAGTINYSANKEREVISGSDTPMRYDDVIQITGSSNGTTLSGEEFSTDIIQPLIKNMEFGCRKHFVSGIIEITRPEKDKITIDFGTGECDNEFTLVYQGETFNLTFDQLRFWKQL